ncbi:MAG: hypothetical protein ACQUYJ_15835, partial [Ferruginibacter sp.]
ENTVIINKYSILTDVQKVNENAILLKFSSNQYFDTKEEIYGLNIWGENISQSISLIKEQHLNTPTVVIDEISELTFYSGNLDESPDWGDWMSDFSLSFDSYEGDFMLKTQEDWDNELLYLIGDRVRTAAFQSKIDSEFRKLTTKQMLYLINDAQIVSAVRKKLAALLSKLNELDDYSFYSLFIDNYKLTE